MKVVCAGLPKTGTKTMAEALRILGYTVHDVFQQYVIDGELWRKVRMNEATTEDFRKTYENVDAVTDFPACGFWENILEAFPNAKVILTVRSSEKEWIGSIQHHGEYVARFMPAFRAGNFAFAIANAICGSLRRDFFSHNEAFLPGCLGTPQMFGPQIGLALRNRYRQHSAYVRSTCPRDQLLVFNVSEGWEPLCRFLGVPVPGELFPRKNTKANIVDSIKSGGYDDCGFYRRMKRQIRTSIALLLAIVVGVIAYVNYSLT